MTKKSKQPDFSTRAIHSGQTPEETTNAVVPPISISVNYSYDDIEKNPGEHTYIRTSNPTREILETRIADLEEANYGSAFSSGIAAIDSVFRMLEPGDHVILGGITYGGTVKLLEEVYSRVNVTYDIVDLSNSDDLNAALKPNTKMVWLESPSNPYFNIVDLAAIAKIAHSKGILCVADNTVASPYLQNPLSFGLDIVIHSATKYLGGHSDVLGGLAVTNSDELADSIKNVQSSAGAVLSPFDSYMVLRGIKTLGVRMDRQSENAMAIAEMLDAHPAVAEGVNYAGLKNHPGHSLAKEQMRNFGAMMSFSLKDGRKAVSQLVKKLQYFVFAESLGAVESIISHPATMSHAILSGTPNAVDESLVRVSVGIESVDDLLEDLQQALS